MNKQMNNTEAVRLAVAKTVGAFRGIDILVNNAGVIALAPMEVGRPEIGNSKARVINN